MNKKFALLLVLLAAMVMGSVASASAAEVKATGSWTISAEWMTRSNFSEDETRTFGIAQRARTAFHFIANENLKAVLNTQIGTQYWGAGALGIGAGRSVATNAAPTAGTAGNGNIMLREGYVKFTVPGTKAAVIGGFQGLSLPSAVGGGSPIFDDQVGSIAAIVPVMDSLSLVGGYARALDAGNLAGSKGSFDVAFGYADVKLNGFNLQPFAAYANVGAKSGGNIMGFQTSNSTNFDGSRAYFGGIAATIDLFNPIKIMADINYGKATMGGTNTSSRKDQQRAGWLFDLQVDYTGLSMMTPSLIFAYSTGENGNSTQGSGKSERMAVIGSPQNYALGSFWMQGSNSLNADGLGGTTQNNLGFWVAGISLKDIKLVDKLSHTVNVLYFKGTNDVDYLKENGRTGTAPTYGQFLTTKDSLWEVDINTKYQIYSELAAHLELGYINPSFNKTAWTGYAGAGQGNKDAYKVTAILNYSF